MTDDPDLVDALAQLTFEVQGRLAALAEAHELSLVQTRLLGVLRDRTPTMADLAGLLGLDKSSVTGLVDRASARGLVTRVPSEDDRRTTHVHLTDDGRRLVTAAAAAFADDIRQLTSVLSAGQQAQLTRLVARILEQPQPARASRTPASRRSTSSSSV